MANHGYCKNCWWWNRHNKTHGNCYFHLYGSETENITEERSYCPDYHARTKGDKSQTLEEWCIEKGYDNFIKYRELYLF